ncbi:hypothetical protein CPB83DRAFT_846525 [Crepidotus variabilis]|uniref:Uncharacterized protein n=1 Tax=Crepidotus variabilis TaxID=179855 RepID=A0A9P6EPU2_9AGAR|nr:hypothetical protein CPB83DRAFT_846525 [Crepidotus variabilis]
MGFKLLTNVALLHASVLILGAGGFAHAQSTTSLFLPGFDPQPLSADVAGVGSDGHTTWAIQKGKPTGTEDPSDFPGTVTLVQGPNDVSMTYAVPGVTMAISCSISASISAVCSEDGQTATVPYEPIAVQLGSTIAGAPTPVPTASGSSASNVAPAAGSRSSSKSPSSTTSQSATLPSNTNSAFSKYSASVWVSLIAVIIPGFMMA